ncbi:MAG: SpoIIE family protein phosphatase, partial [Eubacteriales bacterium]|nr:SpoIIE family protein phosphatase [Eubacteriales bacterium]
EMNMMTPAEAKMHPANNRLTAYIGMDGTVETSFKKAQVQAGDRILLCSDGLTGMVDEATIEDILESEADAENAVKRLVETANNAGGTDNVTVVLADFAEKRVS